MTRLLATFRYEIYAYFRKIAIASGAIAGTVLIISLLPWLGGIEVIDLWEGYDGIFVIYGLIFTTGIFAELHAPGRRIEYLLRPATVWEKVGAKLFVSTILLWFILTFAFLLASILGVIAYVTVGGGLPFGEVFRAAFDDGRWLETAIRAFGAYLPAQAIFFFGSVYFQKHGAGKTLLSIVAWVASYGIATLVSVRLIFARYFRGEVPHSGARRFGHFEGPLSELDIDTRMWREIAPFYLHDPELLRVVMSVVVVLVFWGLSVLRLRETEA